jgi:hypothetical protein
MCFRRSLDSKSRRILSAGYLCLIVSFLLMNFERDWGHRYAGLFTGLRFLFLGCTIGLFGWGARRSRGCASGS